jgi:hypothetical protein
MLRIVDVHIKCHFKMPYNASFSSKAFYLSSTSKDNLTMLIHCHRGKAHYIFQQLKPTHSRNKEFQTLHRKNLTTKEIALCVYRV